MPRQNAGFSLKTVFISNKQNMTCCTIFTKESKNKTQVIWTFKDKKEMKNAQSAYNSHVAGTQKKKKEHVKNGSPKSTNTMK